jgi:hypothetical protein
MSCQITFFRRALIVALLVVSAGPLCNRALGLSPGWPAGPVPTPLPTPPTTATPSPAPSPTPAPTATPSPTPIPPSYVQIITQETPRYQYRDQSTPTTNPSSPYGPYTCVVALYLNSNDPVQFQLVRTFEPRLPNNLYAASQLVSSPGVTTQYTDATHLATVLTTLTVYPHPENPYGRETLSFYSLDSHSTATLIKAVSIMVYPISSAKIYNTFISNPPSSNPSPTPPTPNPTISPYPKSSPYPIPYPSPIAGSSPTNPLVDFTGDAARLNVEIDNAYPGGTTWVVVYPNSAPASVQEVANSRQTAPGSDLVAQRNVFIEVGTAKNISGGLLFPASAVRTTYTVKVIQFRPPYYPPTFQETLATASFSVVSSSFNINSQVGKLTP